MYDKDTGRSRGFGFVYFANDNDATCAKDSMDGKVCNILILPAFQYSVILSQMIHFSVLVFGWPNTNQIHSEQKCLK